MAILTPKEAPQKIIRELDPIIEDIINENLKKGRWEFLATDEMLLDKALVKECMADAGWNCKFEERPTVDPEVIQDWVVLTPKK